MVKKSGKLETRRRVVSPRLNKSKLSEQDQTITIPKTLSTCTVRTSARLGSNHIEPDKTTTLLEEDDEIHWSANPPKRQLQKQKFPETIIETTPEILDETIPEITPSPTRETNLDPTFDFNETRVADAFSDFNTGEEIEFADYEERDVFNRCEEDVADLSDSEEDLGYDPLQEEDEDEFDVQEEELVQEGERVEEEELAEKEQLVGGGGFTNDENDDELGADRAKVEAWKQKNLMAARDKVQPEQPPNVESQKMVVYTGSQVWCVGMTFLNTDLFRVAVINYCAYQGRDLKINLSDKANGQKPRAVCKEGCKFMIYGSWDKKLDCFTVKTVGPDHTCVRNMSKNRQIKSKWLARQFLQEFKSKPHWPAKDICEKVKTTFKILITRELAYKVKYFAAQMLHSSMTEHYGRLGSYLAALKQCKPSVTTVLYTNPDVNTDPKEFKRLFICYDALKQGWLLGYRKLLCVDTCFLKTFLGGQLISAIGREAHQDKGAAWMETTHSNQVTCSVV